MSINQIIIVKLYKIFNKAIIFNFKHQAKLIPDLVIEVLTHNKYNEDASLYSSEYRIMVEVFDRIANRVVK